MYNEAMTRAVLAERARVRDRAMHSHHLLGHLPRRGMARAHLARLWGRRPWSGSYTGTAAPALNIAMKTGDGLRTPPAELRAGQW